MCSDVGKTHVFSFFLSSLSSLYTSKEPTFIIDEKELFRRIVRVMRLTIGDNCILFDDCAAFLVRIQSINKRKRAIYVQTIKVIPKKNALPKVTVFLPLLKQKALAQAVYSCVELGATTIQLVACEKAHRKVLSRIEYDRLQKIIYAGAEQAKNFSLPRLMPVRSLVFLITSPELSNAFGVYYAKSQQTICDLVAVVTQKKPSHIAMIIGPEAGFTLQEQVVIEHFAQTYRLTHTTLRSQQAVALGLGIIRSIS